MQAMTDTNKKWQQQLIPVSSAHQDDLMQMLEQLSNALTKKNIQDQALESVCYTLQVGREAQQHRLAILTDSVETLHQQIKMLLEGKSTQLSNVFCSASAQNADIDPAQIRQALKERDMRFLAEAWVSGNNVEWSELYRGRKMQTISLPTYVFHRKQYAISEYLTDGQPSETDAELRSYETFWTDAPQSAAVISGKRYLICAADAEKAASLRKYAEEKYPHHNWNMAVLSASASETGTLQTVLQEMGRCDGILADAQAVLSDYDAFAVYLYRLLRIAAEQKEAPSVIAFSGVFHDLSERCLLESAFGLANAVRVTMPQTVFRVLMQSACDTEMQFGTVLEAFCSNDNESVLLDGTKRKIEKIRESALQPSDSLLVSHGVYVITGGSGRIAGHAAKWLREQYDAEVMLVSRHICSAHCMDAKVHAYAADACDAAGMQTVLEEIQEKYGRIDGFFHACGLECRENLLSMDAGAFAAVMAPKVKGAMILESWLTKAPASFVCYFSSIASVVGDGGGCCYAAANRFLDALCHHAAQSPTRHLCINWPLWKEGGMHMGADSRDDKYLKFTHQAYLETADAVAFLEKALQSRQPQHILFCNQKGKQHPVLERMLNNAIQEAQPVRQAASQAVSAQKQNRSPQMSGWNVRQCVQWELRAILAELLCLKTEDVHLDTDISDMGCDSVELAKYASRISQKYALRVTPDLFYSYSSVQEIAAFLMEKYAKEMDAFYGTEPQVLQMPYTKKAAEKIISPQKPPKAEADAEKIVLIGMSGIFPGAVDTEALWQIMECGRDVTRNVKMERYSWRKRMSPQELQDDTYGIIGAISGSDAFDPLFFEISPKDAKQMDPKQRLLLEETYHALEDAGIGTHAMKQYTIGMFVGAEDGEYGDLIQDDTQILAGHNALLSARLAYYLDLKGPNMVINTACSSGLTALHQACGSIQRGECDIAVVAGVSVLASGRTYRGMKKAGMVSPSGSCRAFDSAADGMIPAEAAAAVVLMRQDLAQQDGFCSYAVIRGSALAFDGRTNGITAPSGASQQQMIAELYRKMQIQPENVGYILTHGTGTKLGDPIEVNALHQAFASLTEEKQFCAVTSMKPNIGHALAASGIVSLITLAKAMEHRMIPKSIHCEHPNTYIDWENSPLYLNLENHAWDVPKGGKRMGGVSAFGMSGTNVHIVLEEAEPPMPSGDSAACELLVFSAKTKTALTNLLLRCSQSAAVVQHQNALCDVAYTFLEGRMHYAWRCAVIVPQNADLSALLCQAAKGESSPNLYFGQVDMHFQHNPLVMQMVTEMAERTAANLANGEACFEYLQALAEYYCSGYEEPLTALYAERTVRRVHLPSYVFDNKSYWAEECQAAECTAVVVPETETIGTEQIQADILQMLSEILSVAPAVLQAEDAFDEIGLTSVGYAALSEAVNQKYGTEISPMWLYEYPTAAEAAERLCQMSMPQTEQEECASVSAAVSDVQEDAVRYSGCSEDDVRIIVKRALSALLELAAEEIHDAKDFMAYGLDSISMVEFAGMLSEQLHVNVTPVMMYNAPNVSALSAYLMEHFGSELQTAERTEKSEECIPADETAETVLPVSADDADEEKGMLAIIGISGRFPMAENVYELWEILRDGKMAVGTAPADRSEWHSQTAAERRMGFLTHIGEFDPLFFEISPYEAERMDPRQRILLEEIWKALEDAGYSKATLQQEKIGVFVGAEDGEYKHLTEDEIIIANHNAVMAARIAYLLGFHGPNMVVNTACSSGFTALHSACLSLWNGECDTAIVAACNLLITPNSYDIMQKNGMLSAKSECRAFDADADGMVPAEAAAVVILKREDLAVAQHCRIYASIAASHINYDGKSNGMTAPSGTAQTALITETYQRSHIEPENISYVVTHGTGTKLGDPIEWNALTEAYRQFTDKKHYCAVTSVKPNIGHAMAASGLVSLICLLEAMIHDTIPASLHFEKKNPYCEWDDSPFYVNTVNQVWKGSVDSPRYAAVSSFGLSGTNVHIVVKSHEQESVQDSATQNVPLLFVWSAKSKYSLLENIRQMRGMDTAFLEKHLAQISYTLCVCRMHFSYRAAFCAASAEEFLLKCQRLLQEDDTDVYMERLAEDLKINAAQMQEIRQLAAMCAQEKNAEQKRTKLETLAQKYCGGMEDACMMLYANESQQPISLPPYVFEHKTYWLVRQPQTKETASHGNAWLHENVSSFAGIAYESRFSDADYFLKHHVIRGKHTLPGAVYMELVRSAVSKAANHAGAVVLKNIGFRSPAVLDGDTLQLRTELKLSSDSEMQFRVMCRQGQSWEICCNGAAESIISEKNFTMDLSALRQQMTHSIAVEECYAAYQNMRMTLTGTFRSMQEMHTDGVRILTRLESSVQDHAEKGSFLYPEMLDGAFQSTIGYYMMHSMPSSSSMVPFAIQELRILHPCQNQMWSVAEAETLENGDVRFQIVLCDAAGTVCAAVKAYHSRIMEDHPTENAKPAAADAVTQKAESMIMEAVWQEQPMKPMDTIPQTRCILAYHWDELLALLQLQHEEILSDQIAVPMEADMALQYEKICLCVLRQMKQLFSTYRNEPILLQIVLRITEDESVFCGISGLLRTAEKENPNLTAQIITVEKNASAAVMLPKILAENGKDSQVLLHNDTRRIQKWRRSASVIADDVSVKDGGKYVISGGMGKLGFLLAERITTEHRNVKLLLMGRKELTDVQKIAVQRLCRNGCMAEYIAADIKDHQAVKTALRAFSQKYDGISGVFHCAGVIQDKLLLRKEEQEFAAVLQPKTAGLLALDAAASEEKLDFFVCYSSTSASLGSVGQCDYAAGNGFMNAYMQRRAEMVQDGARHGKSLAVCWPLWQDGGMNVTDEVKAYMYRTAGLLPMPTEIGMNLLSDCMRAEASVVTVLYGEMEQCMKQLEK